MNGSPEAKNDVEQSINNVVLKKLYEERESLGIEIRKLESQLIMEKKHQIHNRTI